MDSFALAWKDAMHFPGNRDKETRVTFVLEQIRRLNACISMEQRKEARHTYKNNPVRWKKLRLRCS